MNHNDIRHRLSEYIDGTLTAAEAAVVEEHLKSCFDCSQALGELRKTIEHIKNIEEVEPPAWMAGKIMARVRAENEKKKTFFQRLFFPLHVKLPLETLGVLFLAVTVFFVYQNMEPVEKFSETPTHDFSVDQESAPAVPEKGRSAEPKRSPLAQKEVPQKPEYKALDMKPAYEAPPPPSPAPTPQTARPAEEQRALKYEPSSERKSTEQTPEIMQDQARAKEFSGQGATSQAPASAMARKKSADIASEEKRAGIAPADTSGRQVLTLAVSDLDQSVTRVEDAVREYGGKVIRKEPADGALSLTVAIDVASRNRFIDRLKTLGELKDKDSREIYREGTVIEIRIVNQVQQN